MDEIRDDKLLKALGARFKQLREETGMSNREFADHAGIGHAQINRIDTGQVNVSISTLSAIVKQLGISLSEFFQGL
ncbi:helix-turn-helix domain-containing protein [Chitinophaga rhizosphaerae]|uniref:helix-turn-helix domain-containing protein n=1 Tax=Chitinophaga rhizosphaerae TaxID=1864947 RepID=UPI000F808741|nr:helix-turn-helix domain-containing protein [Chitinophaga rhizosphaerae]